jgi:23S rRNA (guanosine2251-2'-O)-methyltransferase
MEQDQIYGLHAVLAALMQTPEHVDAIWLDANRRDRRIGEIIQAAQAAHIKLHKVPRAKLDQLAGAARHQGVVARYRLEAKRDERQLGEFIANLSGVPFLLVLDGVQDPHNLGACLRSADAAGAHALIIPRDQAVSLTATVRRVACGAAETVPLFQVTNLSRTLKQLKDSGIWLVGAASDAAADLFTADLRGPLALVLGGEESGLRRLTRTHCDLMVQIPLYGSVSSLNVSVTAGICLYEAVRQRKQ